MPKAIFTDASVQTTIHFITQIFTENAPESYFVLKQYSFNLIQWQYNKE